MTADQGQRKTALTPAELEDLKRRRYTQSQIARMKGVSRQRVSQVKYETSRYSMTPRELAMLHYPFDTGARFHDAGPDHDLRNTVEYIAEGGAHMSREKRRRAYGFVRRLRDTNTVLEFDPGIPPHPGVGSGGFAYRRRLPSDRDLMIRVNGFTINRDTGQPGSLSQKQVMLLRLPDPPPEVEPVKR